MSKKAQALRTPGIAAAMVGKAYVVRYQVSVLVILLQ
jgi:hypothetical protein